MNINAAFEWKCQPEAEHLLLNIVRQAVEANPFIAKLEHDLLEKTSTRLFDWLDHVVIDSSLENKLQETGFTLLESKPDYRVYRHLGAQLPMAVVRNQLKGLEIAVSVASITDFILAHSGSSAQIEGSPFGQYRRCLVSQSPQATLWIIERRSSLTMEPTIKDKTYFQRYLEAKTKWQTRLRSLDNEDQAMAKALLLAQEIVNEVGQNLAAWIVLEVEREYWQIRNTAGQIQKNRQDSLGMGWANHDHHTFRSSRRRFHQLVHLFEILGFHCRERFYAGQEAGWGAQVMENPNCRLVLFLDVDLSPNEIEDDFAHQSLPELSQLGTIGLWCALHGDSILHAGMHHLEAQFMFDNLTEDMGKIGVQMMNPFSFFPYLKQAFTVGEMWPVEPKRVEQLVKDQKITEDQSKKFLSQGALGSHMENLQRREGYKGFNQKNVSIIIKKTDPRNQ